MLAVWVWVLFSSPPSPLCRKRLMSCLHSLHAVHRRAVPNNTLLYSYRIYNGRWMWLEGKTLPEGIVVKNLRLLFTELCVYGALSLIWTLDSAADMWSLNNDFRPQWFLALWTFGVGIESNGTKFAQNMEQSYCGRSLFCPRCLSKAVGRGARLESPDDFTHIYSVLKHFHHRGGQFLTWHSTWPSSQTRWITSHIHLGNSQRKLERGRPR